MEPVVYAEVGEDVELILRLVVADEGGIGLEDGVGGKDGGAGDGEVGGMVGRSPDEQGDEDAKYQERDEYRSEEVAADGLGEGQRRHFEPSIIANVALWKTKSRLNLH